MKLAALNWGSPEWLWALLLVPAALALLAASESRSRRAWTKLVAARLVPRLVRGFSARRRWLRHALWLGSFAALTLALARPQRGFTEQRLESHGGDVVFILDVSRSMLADDTAPNRLEAAKRAAYDVFRPLGGQRVGVVAVAGGAFLQAPLTNDHRAVSDVIKELDPAVLPRGGTRLSDGLREAGATLKTAPGPGKAVVLFSDGEDLEGDSLAAAHELAAQGVRLHCIGIGTAAGSLIPVRSQDGPTEFIRDPDGNYVRSHLEAARLSALAEATGGLAVMLSENHTGPAQIAERLGTLEGSAVEEGVLRIPNEAFLWPLTAAALLWLAWWLFDERSRRTALPADRRFAKVSQ